MMQSCGWNLQRLQHSNNVWWLISGCRAEWRVLLPTHHSAQPLHWTLCSVLQPSTPFSGKIFLWQDGTCYGKSVYQIWCLLFLFLFLSRPRSEGWPHCGRTFSIYPCPLSFWLTLPRRVLSTSWCCPSRPCVAFLAWVHLALFLALSLSPGNSLVSSLCDHNMLPSLLWRCLTVPSLLQLC